MNSTYTTLDGDITNMQRWHFDFFTESDESGAAAHDLMFGSDALIMGRQTYEGFRPRVVRRGRHRRGRSG